MRFLLGFILMMSCLAGCTVGPDYTRPSVDVPAVYRFEEKEAMNSANTLWWRQFEDPILDALIDETLAYNKDIQLATANIEKAAGTLMQSRSQIFPQFNYSGGGTRQRGSEAGASAVPQTYPNPQTAIQGQAGASWEIDLWGRIQRLTESAQASLLATEEARQGVILSLVSSVASNYIQILGLDMQLKIAKRTLETYAESVKLFDLQFRYGQVSQMTLEQARTQYETAAGKIPQIESQIAQTENALSILLGRNPGPIARTQTIFQLKIPEIPEGVPSDVLENRPDIREAEQNLIAANAQIGAARALYFPTISLTGAYGASSAELSNLFTGSARAWSYAGSITGPIFTAGSIAGQVKYAEANRQAAIVSYEKAIQNAFADVENALVSRRKLAEQLRAQQRLVKASKEYERLALLQYKGGYATYLTVLDAQQQLFPAELDYAQYLASSFASYVNIYKAMGGGWVTESENLYLNLE
jgi:multidrug efflux system outer membrane protein